MISNWLHVLQLMSYNIHSTRYVCHAFVVIIFRCCECKEAHPWFLDTASSSTGSRFLFARQSVTHPAASSTRPPPSSAPVWGVWQTPPSWQRWPGSVGPGPRRPPRSHLRRSFWPVEQFYIGSQSCRSLSQLSLGSWKSHCFVVIQINLLLVFVFKKNNPILNFNSNVEGGGGIAIWLFSQNCSVGPIVKSHLKYTFK